MSIKLAAGGGYVRLVSNFPELSSFGANGAADVSLRECAMEPLPPGAVRAEGWLLGELVKQRDGLTGNADELYDDIGRSDWLTNAGRKGQYSWERGPYYARGLVALAFALDDEDAQGACAPWVDAVIASQARTAFWPKKNNWWANMLPLWYLRDWADDWCVRVVPFLERIYSGVRAETHAVQDEAAGRCARRDEMGVLWLHRRTGNAKWLAFARFLSEQTADWTTYYLKGGDPGSNAPGCGGYRSHIVNFMQGLKCPALKWVLGGGARDRAAPAAAFAPDGWVMRHCGRPDAMVNGSEPLTDRSASGGTELCAIVERINSARTLLSVFGDASTADDLEDVAYNSLRATVAPDGKGTIIFCS